MDKLCIAHFALNEKNVRLYHTVRIDDEQDSPIICGCKQLKNIVGNLKVLFPNTNYKIYELKLLGD